MTAKTKPCTREGCGGIVVKHRKDSRQRWESRKYCCLECAKLDQKGSKRGGYNINCRTPTSKEYVMPADFKSLVGYHSAPPAHLAAGVRSRYLRGAACCY